MLAVVFNCKVPLAWLNVPPMVAGPAVVTVPALRKMTPFDATLVFVTVKVPAVMSSFGVPVAFVSPRVSPVMVTVALLVTV